MIHRIVIVLIRVIRYIKSILSDICQRRFRIAFPCKTIRKHNTSQLRTAFHLQPRRNLACRNRFRHRKTDIFGERIVFRRICRRINRRIGRSTHRHRYTAVHPRPPGGEDNVRKFYSFPVCDRGQNGRCHNRSAFYHSNLTFSPIGPASGTAYRRLSRRNSRDFSLCVNDRNRRIAARKRHVIDMVYFGTVHIRNQRDAFIHFKTAYCRFIQCKSVRFFGLCAGRSRHVLIYGNLKYKLPLQYPRFGISPVNFTAFGIGRFDILHILMRIISVFAARDIKFFQIKGILLTQNILIANNIRPAAQGGVAAVPSLFHGSF